MKLKFEPWLIKNRYSPNALALFRSSIDCYKAQVYPASLLMGYLEFVIVLKDSIMEAQLPSAFPRRLWLEAVRELQNEDLWEAAAFNAVPRKEITQGSKADPSFFRINDNIRNQLRYWKDRRNYCAHFKDNQINIPHVESFWAFLESNLQKITIEVTILCEELGREAWISFSLVEHMETFFFSNSTKKIEFRNIAKRNGAILPEKIKTLYN